MRIAILFWGLCRSTNYTIDSLKQSIFNILKNNNINYDIYLHTYSINGLYNNIRAKEINCIIDNNLYKLLNPDYFIIEDQNTVDKELDLEKYRKCGDPWKSKNFETFNNHIRALYSLKQVTELMLSKNISYDRIIFCRPDVKFTTSLIIDYFYQPDNDIILPNFHNYPINDRFAICSVETAKKYGLRFYDAYKYSQKKKLHSETFLNYILSNNKINICKKNIRFKRVRCDGKEFD